MVGNHIRFIDVVVAVVVVAIALYLYFFPSDKRDLSEEDAFEPEKVQVIHGRAQLSDGDSLYLNRQKVRLIGIDAPELHQLCEKDGTSYPCGEMSKQHLETLINDNEISCTYTKTDKFDRLLGRCHAGQTDLNRQMVKDGWAVSYYDYKQEEAKARRQKFGIWAGSFEWPHTWRRAHPR